MKTNSSEEISISSTYLVKTTNPMFRELPVGGALLARQIQTRFQHQRKLKNCLHHHMSKGCFNLTFLKKTKIKNIYQHRISCSFSKLSQAISNAITASIKHLFPLRQEKFRYRPQALSQLGKLKRRLKNDSKYRKVYLKFMGDFMDEGNAERERQSESNRGNDKIWGLPHHDVYHQKKLGKIRFAFDCRVEYKGQCLKHHLLREPDLTNNLFGTKVVYCTRLSVSKQNEEPVVISCTLS